jgi:stage II sporulation protein E
MFLQIAQTAQLRYTLSESLVAVILFIFMPKGVSLTLSRVLPGTEERMELEMKKQERLQTLVIKRLSQFAEIFCELSGTFSQTTATDIDNDNISLDRLVEVLTNQICRSCGGYAKCWQQNFYASYQKMMELVASVEEQKQPEQAADSWCQNQEKLITTLRYLFSMQRLDQSWQQKLVETSNIVSSQLRGIAKVMDNLATELNTEVSFKEDLEELVQKELSKLGFTIEKVEVMELEEGKVAVELVKGVCDGSEECRKAITPLVGQILGREFSIWNVHCGRKNCQGRCKLNLVPKCPFRVESSVQRFNKADGIISGDSHALLELQDGKLAVALSDGMGSGAEAALQSGATISILKRLLESGFDRESAVRTVNSVLLARSVEESFATIDLAVFDLHKAQLELIKVGAAPTYIKRGREVVRVDSACLPIGIISSIEIESATRSLRDGDLVVMVTDGLTQLRRSGGPALRGDWIARMLQRLKADDPEEIAYELIIRAREINFNKVEDDMTVLVLKVVACQDKYSQVDLDPLLESENSQVVAG